MKVSKKLIQRVITEVAGEETMPLVGFLKNKKNVSEFRIAEKIDCEINECRRMLYKLQQANLVTFTKKKDKTKGWYVYYWTFNPKVISYLEVDLKKKRLEGLKDRLKRENENHFFACEHGCCRLEFDQAVGFEFKCPECGSLMQHEDNKRMISDVKTKIKQLEDEIVDAS
jgi:transcription initiation factor TFIIE subunit alpha